MKRKWLAIGIILLFVGVTIAPTRAQNIEKSQSSRGDWLYVGGSGSGNYTRIQDAIDNANDGDTVFVYDDSSPYDENLRIKKSIQLIGENKTSTIINSSSQITIDTYDYDNIFIQGFTLLNNCTSTKQTYGVGIVFAENFTLTDTIIIGCHWGVKLVDCSNCSIENNEIRDGTFGISAYEVFTSTFGNNTIVDNKCGIEFNYAKNNKVNNNTFRNNGMLLSGYSYPNSYFGNTVNNKPLLYVANKQNLIIQNTSVGQLYLLNCTNITVRNIEVSNASYGIEIIRSNNCLITKTNVHSNYNAGITLQEQCQNNTISYNEITSNDYGINCESYYLPFEYNNFIGNTIRFNRNGICVEGSKNTIQDNIVENNDKGIRVIGSQNKILNNAIRNSTTTGLYLYEAERCLIKSNNFINNQDHAEFEKYSILGSHFRSNYWSNSTGIGPKIIWGSRGFVVGFDRNGWPIIQMVPWIQFDWFSVKEPYDIPGMR
ncbi:MAG: right-handed parallel beta-helix repeat-containing protein [Candidatus Thermoplasmatota archaeon]|jgi:parallel beta-helix repeat protein|nr:right-handed parallel beta-helix repeat-containing protein [Candidatus Thermoplasmatota archaeon]